MTTSITTRVSRVRPLYYLVGYFVSIPAFGLLYAFACPHDFYAPYARVEPAIADDRSQLATSLEFALRRAYREEVAEAPARESLRVLDLDSADGSQLTFTIAVQWRSGLARWRGSGPPPLHPIARVIIPDQGGPVSRRHDLGRNDRGFV